MAPQPFPISVNNQKITCLEYTPERELKGVVLFCHGFPGTNRMPKLAQVLNERGFGMVELNYRGDKASEGEFSFLGSIEDVEESVKQLRKKFVNVPLTALGFSAGGLYVSIAAHNNPDLFDRIVLLNPLVDASFLSSDNPLMGKLWKEAAAMLTLQEREEYEHEVEIIKTKHNPIDFASEMRTPMVIVQGTDDEVLPVEVVEEFFGRLKGIKEFTWIVGGKHGVEGDEKEIVEAALS
ncbi:MAG: alpha/beta fold hydrolase [Parcubacteria group bacterium]